jgi:hypothetical protein
MVGLLSGCWVGDCVGVRRPVCVCIAYFWFVVALRVWSDLRRNVRLVVYGGVYGRAVVRMFGVWLCGRPASCLCLRRCLPLVGLASGCRICGVWSGCGPGVRCVIVWASGPLIFLCHVLFFFFCWASGC